METALVVPASATGSLQASHHEIDAALAPALHRVEPRTNRVSLDDIAARIEAGHPDLVVGYFLFAPRPGAAIRVIMNTRSAAHPGDPVAGVGWLESRGYYQVRFLPPGTSWMAGPFGSSWMAAMVYCWAVSTTGMALSETGSGLGCFPFTAGKDSVCPDAS